MRDTGGSDGQGKTRARAAVLGDRQGETPEMRGPGRGIGQRRPETRWGRLIRYQSRPRDPCDGYLAAPPSPAIPTSPTPPAMPAFTSQPADEISIATIRALAADVVGKANSGHPGAYRSFWSDRVAGPTRLSSQVLPWGWRLSPTSSSPGEEADGILCDVSFNSASVDSSTRTPRARSGTTAIVSSSPMGAPCQYWHTCMSD